MTPLPVLIEVAVYYLIGINLLTFLLYGADKMLAQSDSPRLSEATLLTFAMVGGTPAAFAACEVFDLKTRKEGFRTALRMTAIVHCLIFAWCGLSYVGIVAGPLTGYANYSA